MSNLGQRIKESRLSQAMSQRELAAKTQVSQPTVANWENGSHAPRNAALTRIASALNTPASWFLDTETSLKQPSQDHNIPLLNWPHSQEALDTSPVQSYIKATTRAARPIAMINQDEKMSTTFGLGATIILDRADTAPQANSLYLIVTDTTIALRRHETDNQYTDDSGTQYEARQVLAKAVLSIKDHP